MRPPETDSISLFLDDAVEPFATYRPPATVALDTTALADGPHVLRIVAHDGAGRAGIRTIPFEVQNGPGITVTGLHAHERVAGTIDLNVNAFSGGSEPFDPLRAESSGPIPVWTWVMIALIGAWASWYGLTQFQEPAAFAQAGSANAVAAATEPMGQRAPAAFSGRSGAAGFDFAATGPNLYAGNCASCHGASGAGVPSVFPPLAGDPVVTAADPALQLRIVLHGLSGKAIGGKSYASQMPSFTQLTDNEIAAIVDHERTSWGNRAPTVSPDDVKRSR